MRRRTLAGAVLFLFASTLLLLVLFHLRRPVPPAATAGAWAAVVTTIAGRGVPGFADGPSGLARFSDPFGVTVAPDGAVYVADAGDSNRIRRVAPDGAVTTVAGGASEGRHDGVGAAAAFHTPSGLAIGADGTLYVADTGAHAIRRVGVDGSVSTVAGDGLPGRQDGPGPFARLDGPIGIGISPGGDLFVADSYNDSIRRIDVSGTVTTVAGADGPGYLDGPAATARFDTPSGVVALPDGTLLVADTGNGLVRRIGDGQVTTLAVVPFDANADVTLIRPIGIAAGDDGTVYVTDRRGRILQILPDGRGRVLAGSRTGFADGSGRSAAFHNPTGIALDREGALVVADAANYMVRRLAPAGLYPPDAPRSPLAPAPGLPIESLAAQLLPWPLDPQFGWHEVTGTMGEARGSSSDSRERFHTGIDVRADHGAVVHAVRSGKVDSPLAALAFDSINESVAIGPFTYVHLRVGRDRGGRMLDPNRFAVTTDGDGAVARVRVRRGTRVALGDALGTVNRFSHVHLNAGLAGREANPLLLPLVGFMDRIPPTIERGRIRLLDQDGLPFPVVRGRVVVRGISRIVVDAYDRVDGNAPRRRLGVHRLGYQVLHADGTPAPGFETARVTIEFDRLPQDPRAAALVYAPGSGITVYGARRTRFLYNVHNHVRAGTAEESAWDTSTLAPGPYTLRILAADAAGNEAVAGRDVRVVVER